MAGAKGPKCKRKSKTTIHQLQSKLFTLYSSKNQNQAMNRGGPKVAGIQKLVKDRRYFEHMKACTWRQQRQSGKDMGMRQGLSTLGN